MKRKLLLVCMFLIAGIALNQVFAQDKTKRTEQGWVESQYWSPVFCGDELVDILEGGYIKVHYVIHYDQNGYFTWETDQLKGEVTSGMTGETFRIREIDKWYFTDHLYLTWHYHLVGDQGTHYMGVLTYSYYTGMITIGITNCH